MSDEKLKDFKSLKEAVGKQRRLVDDTIDIKQDNIEQETKSIGELRKCSNQYGYIDDILNDVPDDQIASMDDAEYDAFTGIARDTVFSGEVVYDVYKESRSGSAQYVQHYNYCASLDQITVSGTSGYIAMSNAKPEYFPNKDKIIQTYQVEDKLFSNIDSIRDYLGKHFPDILPDYEYLIDKYNAFKADSAQYQDLIGSRSLFFYKMIYEYTKSTYGFDKPRIDSIRKFVFGSTAPISSAESMIRSSKRLWDEFSDQNDPTQSIKLGNVTPPYVDSTFRRIIGSIATILNLRDMHFTP